MEKPLKSLGLVKPRFDEPVEKYYGPPKPPVKGTLLKIERIKPKHFPVKPYDIAEMYTRGFKKMDYAGIKEA